MIESKDNPKVKLARSLVRYKKIRYQEQLFVLENKHFIKEWIQKKPTDIHYILYSGEKNSLDTIIPSNIECVSVEEHLFKQIPSIKTSSGVIAVVAMPHKETLFNTSAKKVVLLHDINKPSNVGAIIRNAVAFNMDAVVVTKHCADIFHPESIRASAGSITELPVYTLSDTVTLNQLSQFKSFYLDSNAEKTMPQKESYEQELYIFGSEMGYDKVLSPILNNATGLRIDQSKAVDSLNVAVSSGIFLYYSNA